MTQTDILYYECSAELVHCTAHVVMRSPESTTRKEILSTFCFCEAQARVRQVSQGERPQSLNPSLELTLKLVATRVMTGRVWQRAAYIRRYISFRCRHWIQLTPLRAELSQQWAAGACYQTQFTNYRCLLLSAYSLDTTSASCRWVAALLHDYQMWQRWEMSNQRQMVIK